MYWQGRKWLSTYLKLGEQVVMWGTSAAASLAGGLSILPKTGWAIAHPQFTPLYRHFVQNIFCVGHSRNFTGFGTSFQTQDSDRFEKRSFVQRRNNNLHAACYCSQYSIYKFWWTNSTSWKRLTTKRAMISILTLKKKEFKKSMLDPFISRTYTVLHIFRQVLFGAGNQGNHQNFENPCFPSNVD